MDPKQNTCFVPKRNTCFDRDRHFRQKKQFMFFLFSGISSIYKIIHIQHFHLTERYDFDHNALKIDPNNRVSPVVVMSPRPGLRPLHCPLSSSGGPNFPRPRLLPLLYPLPAHLLVFFFSCSLFCRYCNCTLLES